MKKSGDEKFRARFVAGMRRAASGVAIVTSGEDGATVNAFSAVTADPPAVMVCLHNGGRTRRTLAARRMFSVNVLSRRHARLADLFAGRTGRAGGAEKNGAAVRDRNGRWTGWAVSKSTGARILKGAAARFDCRLARKMVYGSHTIFIGEVLEATSGKSPPLAYANRRFCKVSPLNGAEGRA